MQRVIKLNRNPGCVSVVVIAVVVVADVVVVYKTQVAGIFFF